MPKSMRSAAAAFIIVLYGTLVLATTYFFELKKSALDFHTRDYAFYMETYARTFDFSRASMLSIQPEGVNMFFMSGTDGAHGVHATIHFEPIKYALSVVYQIAGTTGVFFVFSALFWFPVVYTYIALRRFGIQRALFACVTYGLFPLGIMWATRDVRPLVLLAPAIAVLSIGLLAQRPSREIVLATLILFCLREETVIVLVPLIGVTHVIHRDAFRSLISAYCFGTAAIAGYYAVLIGGDFHNFPPVSMEIVSIWLTTVFLSVIVIAAVLIVRPKKVSDVFVCSEVSWRISLCVQYLPVLVALGIVLFEGEGRFTSEARFLPVLWISIWYAVVATGFLFIREAYRQTFVIIFTIVVAIISAVTLPGFISQVMELRVRATLTQMPHRVARERVSNRTESIILTDYAAHQAFVDVDAVYAFDRIPSWLVKSGSRYWPDTIGVLTELIHSGKVESLIVSADRMDDVRLLVGVSSVAIEKIEAEGVFVRVYISNVATINR